MANTATALGTIPGGIRRLGNGCQTVAYLCAFDTTGSALTVHSPDSARYWAIVGIHYAEATAHSLTITAGSTDLVVLENAANTVIHEPCGRIWLASPVLGGALKITCGTAAVSSLLVYVQEFETLEFGNP